MAHLEAKNKSSLDQATLRSLNKLKSELEGLKKCMDQIGIEGVFGTISRQKIEWEDPLPWSAATALGNACKPFHEGRSTSPQSGNERPEGMISWLVSRLMFVPTIAAALQPRWLWIGGSLFALAVFLPMLRTSHERVIEAALGGDEWEMRKVAVEEAVKNFLFTVVIAAPVLIISWWWISIAAAVFLSVMITLDIVQAVMSYIGGRGLENALARPEGLLSLVLIRLGGNLIDSVVVALIWIAALA